MSGGGAAPEFWAWARECESGCWLWLGSTRRGYGVFRHGGERHSAHRYAYEALVAPVPEGLVLDHLCRRRNCINPAHLDPVTDRINILRGVGVASQLASATKCKRGHALTGDNVILERRANRSAGYQRRCRTCRREYVRARRDSQGVSSTAA